MKQFTVAVIGLGNSGRNIHCRYLGQMADKYKVIAVADTLEERRIKAERELGCKAYEDYRVMVDECPAEIVVNTLPSHLHVSVSMELLNKGFNVVCEKPLTNSVREVDMLAECVEKTGKLFTVFQDLRFSPHFVKVKEVLKSGVLGRIVQISMYMDFFRRNWNWQTLRKYNGGRLMNTGAHIIDRALLLAGEGFSPSVTCKLDRGASFGDAEDYVKLILQAPGYPLFDLEMSSCCAYPPFTYNIQGTCGGLTGTPRRLQWKYFKPSEAPVREVQHMPISDKDGDPAYCYEELKWYEEIWEDSRSEFDVAPVEFYESLYRTLTEGAPPEVTLQQIRRQVEIIEECFRQNPDI